jgi:hypothetical protein
MVVEAGSPNFTRLNVAGTANTGGGGGGSSASATPDNPSENLEVQES